MNHIFNPISKFNTYLQDNSYSIRVGNNVPNDAVNLSYYYNKDLNNIDNVVCSDASKLLIDHITARHYKTLFNLPTQDDTLFQNSYLYLDAYNYTSTLNLQNVSWISKIITNSIPYSYTNTENITDIDNVTKSYFYSDNGYSGKLLLTNKTINSYVYNNHSINMYVSKSFQNKVTKTNLVVDNNIFDHTIAVNSGDYTGYIPLLFTEWYKTYTDNFDTNDTDSETIIYGNESDIPKYITHTLPDGTEYYLFLSNTVSTSTTHTDNITYPDTGSIPTSVVETFNGQSCTMNKTNQVTNTHTHTGSTNGDAQVTGDDYVYRITNANFANTITKTIDGVTNVTCNLTGITPVVGPHPVKVYDYGLSRYWSPSSDVNAEYGSGVGIWSQTYPGRMQDFYDHVIGTGFPGTAPDQTISSSGWSYSTWLSQQFVVGANGIVWKSSVPDAGHNPTLMDHIAAITGSPVYYNNISGNGEVPWNDVDSRFTAEVNTAMQMYYSPTPFYDGSGPNYYSREVLLFYERWVNRATYVGTYNYSYDTYDYTATFTGETFTYTCTFEGIKPQWSLLSGYTGNAYYLGEISRGSDVTNTVQSIQSINVSETYNGIVTKDITTYTGTAYYENMAIKNNKFMNSNSNNITLMYPSNNNILRNIDTNVFTLNSESFLVTNIFKNDIPLFYRYKLKYPIYSNIDPDKINSLEYNGMNIVNSLFKPLGNTMQYMIKLTPYGIDNLYNVYIYTSFNTHFNSPIYAIYNAYDTSNNNIIPKNIETINVYPFYNDYTVNIQNEDQLINYITVNSSNIITDTRNKLHFKYKIQTTDGVYTSNSYDAYAINKNYALYTELNLYNDNNLCISPYVNNRHLNAYEVIKQDCINQLVDTSGNYNPTLLSNLSKNTFIVIFDKTDADTLLNYTKLNIYTEPDGNSPIYVETTEDTGIFNIDNNNFDLQLSVPSKYIVQNNNILSVFAVMQKDTDKIDILNPVETGKFENWYPKIKFGHYNNEYEQYNVRQVVSYTMPEYNNQLYSTTYGKPYIDITNEYAAVINENTIKVRNYPLYLSFDSNGNVNNITISRITIDENVIPLSIDSVSYIDGYITINNKINMQDKIIVNYTYEEQNYIYKGYYDQYNNFVDLDLNLLKYHTFLDNRNEIYDRKPVYDLINSNIYLFMRPTIKYTIPTTINVLEVYPYKPILETWMNDYSLGTISVESMSIDDFNNNPNIVNQYNVVVFGFAKQYNNKQLSLTAYNVLDKYILNGNGVIFTEDVLDTNYTGNNFYNLAHKYMEVTFDNTKNTYNGTNIINNKTGLLTTFPYDIGNSNYTIPYSGNNCIVSSQGDIWYNYNNDTDNSNFFLLTYNNLAIINIGRQITTSTQDLYNAINIDEQKILVNTIYYISQINNQVVIPVPINNTLYHKFDDYTPDNPDDILLGKIYLRHNSSLQNTVLFDTRSNGGGIIESMTDDLRKTLEPESDYYFDIGSYDGEGYSENSVIIVRLDKRLLKQNGGRFEKFEIEDSVNKWAAYGSMPIIEYI